MFHLRNKCFLGLGNSLLIWLQNENEKKNFIWSSNEINYFLSNVSQKCKFSPPPENISHGASCKEDVCRECPTHQCLHQGLLSMRTESHKIPLAQSYQGIDEAMRRLVLYCKLPRHAFLMGKGACNVLCMLKYLQQYKEGGRIPLNQFYLSQGLNHMSEINMTHKTYRWLIESKLSLVN